MTTNIGHLEIVNQDDLPNMKCNAPKTIQPRLNPANRPAGATDSADIYIDGPTCGHDTAHLGPERIAVQDTDLRVAHKFALLWTIQCLHVREHRRTVVTLTDSAGNASTKPPPPGTIPLPASHPQAQPSHP